MNQRWVGWNDQLCVWEGRPNPNKKWGRRWTDLKNWREFTATSQHQFNRLQIMGGLACEHSIHQARLCGRRSTVIRRLQPNPCNTTSWRPFTFAPSKRSFRAHEQSIFGRKPGIWFQTKSSSFVICLERLHSCYARYFCARGRCALTGSSSSSVLQPRRNQFDAED